MTSTRVKLAGPVELYAAPISSGARLVGCRLWDYAVDTPRGYVATVIKAALRRELCMGRQSLDRHIRDLQQTGWLIWATRIPCGELRGTYEFGLYWDGVTQGLAHRLHRQESLDVLPTI